MTIHITMAPLDENEYKIDISSIETSKTSIRLLVTTVARELVCNT